MGGGNFHKIDKTRNREKVSGGLGAWGLGAGAGGDFSRGGTQGVGVESPQSTQQGGVPSALNGSPRGARGGARYMGKGGIFRGGQGEVGGHNAGVIWGKGGIFRGGQLEGCRYNDMPLA